MNTVQGVLFDETISTNSLPVPVLCSDDHTYFTKFPLYHTDHTDLAYEVICKFVGDHFRVPIPATAYVEAVEYSYEPSYFPTLQPGVIGFGSREIGANVMLSKSTALVSSKHDFNRLANPNDLVKIGIFDLHTGNMDRCEENFNLLLEYGDRDKIIAIDHIAAFRSSASKGNFKPTAEDSVGNNILRSEYGQRILKYISKDERAEILNLYRSGMKGVPKAIDQAFKTFPEQWELDAGLKERVSQFLTDPKRIASISEVFKTFLRIL